MALSCVKSNSQTKKEIIPKHLRHYAQHRRLSSALATLQPQRQGIVDAYVVSVALDTGDVAVERQAMQVGQ